MILEVAHLQIIPGNATDFEQAFARAQHIISAMPGYLGHQLQRALDDPHHYLLLVQWERLEDHTRGFRGSPPVPGVEGPAAPLLRPLPQGRTFSGCNTDQRRKLNLDQTVPSRTDQWRQASRSALWAICGSAKALWAAMSCSS